MVEYLNFERCIQTYVHVAILRRNHFVAYFDRVTAFKVLYLWTSIKGGAQTRCVSVAAIDATTNHV